VNPDPQIIPRPEHVVRVGSDFTIDAGTGLSATEELRAVADLIAGALRDETGLPLSFGSSSTNVIRLSLDPTLGKESYRLRVDERQVQISGGDPAGTFYGYQTLRQLMPVRASAAMDASTPWVIPGVWVDDRPAFRWRGSMLDVGKHFMPKEFIFRFLDLIAMHKLNVFHWHLTEDQGWRIEIKRYPRLTEIGAWRSETMVGRPADDPLDDVFDNTQHGGFYTQDDIREIVAYAARRFITVVPEIDVPGHSQAAIAAYPELGNLDRPVQVSRGWRGEAHSLNVEESTVEFFKNVYDEVFELFPSPFVHAGGDECFKTEWQNSPRAQERIRELGLADEEQLQSWFMKSLATHFAERGRRLIGWDEILQGGLADGATVMSWRGPAGGIEAARAGHDVVMCDHSYVYLDYYQSQDHEAEPVAIGGFLPLERVYGYNPVPDELKPYADRVMGSQCHIWTEHISTPQQVEYMMFPRACAFAEVVWCRRRDSYEEFRNRLTTHLTRLDRLGVNYRKLT